jgi:protein TonB
MPPVPPALQYLALSGDASVQEVRRAYAQRVKQIDQATQADLFQQLREAYTAALAWCQARDRGQAPDTPLLGDPPHGAAARPAPAADPRETAAEVFHRFIAQVVTDPASAHRQLADTLDDPRLIDLEAWQHFEGLVVQRLAGGWQPGHEFLFDAAVTIYGWDTEAGRLLQFGEAGQLLDRAVMEHDLFQSQSPQVLPLQHDLLERVRHGRRPSDTDLVRTMCVLGWLTRHYQRWLFVTVGADNTQRWADWHAALPAKRQSIDRPHPEPTHAPEWRGIQQAPNPGRRTTPQGLRVMVFFLSCLVVAMVLGAWLANH